MEPGLLRQNSSRANVTDASRDLGCDPWSIHQPRPPYLAGTLASAGGSIYVGVAYCAMSQFVTLAANSMTLKFWFFVITVYYEKIGHRLKPLVPKFCLDLSVLSKDIVEKQVPAKLKLIVGDAKWWWGSKSSLKIQIEQRLPSPHSPKKGRKLAKYTLRPIFDSFGEKEGQMLFHLNFGAMFGILSSFSISYDPIWYYFHI